MAGEQQNEQKLLEQMLEFETQIQQAISELSNREAIFKDVCQEIQSPFGFDLALIALINPEKNIEQTVYQVNINGDNLTHSYIRYKYYLEKNPDLRSIRADIIQTRNIEIIAGSDKRLNLWTIKEEEKKERVRIYIPIILIQDKNGNIIEDWFDNCEWKVITKEQTEDGYRTVIKMDLSIQENQTLGNIQVIGVVGTIYDKPTQEISVEEALVLAKLVSVQALKIRRAQLSYILEVITKNARRILQADVAAIDFMYQPEQQSYVYQVCTGNIDKNFTSRKQKLGQQALQEGKTIFVTNTKSNSLNNLGKLFGQKSKAFVTFPLTINQEQGFLYLEFQNENEINQDKITLFNLFLNRANNAIFHGINQADKQAQETQINNIYLLTKSLIDKTEKDIIIKRIVWQIFYILGADVVIFNEYLQSEKKVITSPEIAGLLIQEKDKYPDLNQDDKSLMLIKHGTNIYESSLENSELFQKSEFVKQENIKSVASILLQVGDETVGVIFINYRRMYNFSKDEQKVIETLASAAANAIQNQRWLQSWLDALSDIDRDLITTLEEKKLLNKIVERAVEKIKADFGSIRLLLPNNRELETKAFYPPNTPRQVLQRTNIEQGITGWVANNRQPAIVNDIQQDPRFLGDVENVRSELCVPLLDKKERLIGVLNVESHQVNAFEAKDLRLLQQIAHLAVIAIQNAKKQELLAKSEAMVTLGDIAGPLVHRTNNNVGAIRVLAQDICDEADEDEDIKSLATEIVSIAEQVLEYSQKMRSWMKDQFQIINLEKDIIKNILTKINIPENIQTNINIDSDLYQVHAGKQQLINVFENLIQNAITAMSNGGELFIEGSNLKTDAREWIKICVCDTGVGIAEENLDKIFEPGFSTKDSSKNMGFGLWWTKFYIERLEGSLEVESEVGKITHFTIILPAYEKEV